MCPGNWGKPILWKLVRENGALWIGNFYGVDQEWHWVVDEDSLIFERLRENWATFCSVADGSKSSKELPSWPRTRPRAAGDKSGFSDMDDDIPF
jgi:hypothetical protein